MSFIDGPLVLIFNTKFGRCPNIFRLNLETRCRFTTDQERFSEADVVIFHLPSMTESDYPIRRPGQRWVAWCAESIAYVPALADSDFMAQFDLTIGYWREASVWAPYFDGRTPYRLRAPPRAKTEAAPAAFFQSSRWNQSGRIDLVRELMNYLPVDCYGKILNNRQLATPDTGTQSKLRTIARHKFTLALENSVARDYVTEKFFQPLIAGSVPVYLGAPNIAEYAPGQDCFINVSDFDGPASLASYLQQLTTDSSAYEKYLAWKKRPLRNQFLEMVKATNGNPMLRLCGVVQPSSKGRKTASAGLSRIGYLTNQPHIQAALRPSYYFLRRIFGHL